MPALFLGVDGGQSGTLALVGDEGGNVIGIGRGGPCHDEGSLSAALDQAGALGLPFEAACFGLSGGAKRHEAQARSLIQAARYVFTHDADIALTGALAGEPGIIVIAGTGSISFGGNRDGRTARAGGWGYAFGDEGGAFDLVRHALRAVLRNEEGWGPPTALRGLLLDAANASSANELMHRFYSGDVSHPRLAALAPLVDQAAAGGDNAAQEILKSAGQTLATFAAAVRGQLFAPEGHVSIGYAGGVFRSSIVLERFRMLVELEDGNHVESARYAPAAGALLQAYRSAQITCTLKNVPEEKL
jgi:N-acetylglucosamine kinase-like BadF-type ATPase